MYGSIKEHLQKELKEIEEAGLYKKERIITTSQDAVIKVSTGEEVINFCANVQALGSLHACLRHEILGGRCSRVCIN